MARPARLQDSLNVDTAIAPGSAILRQSRCPARAVGPVIRRAAFRMGLVEIVGILAGCGVLLPRLAEFVVVVWSLRADERDRAHALVLLKALRGERPRARRAPPGRTPAG